MFGRSLFSGADEVARPPKDHASSVLGGKCPSEDRSLVLKTDGGVEVCAPTEVPSSALGHMRMILDIGRTIPALLQEQLLALPEAPLQQIHRVVDDAREILRSQEILSCDKASTLLNFPGSTNAVDFDDEAVQNTFSIAGEHLETQINRKIAAIADIVNAAMERALLASPNEYHGKVCGGHVNLIQLNKRSKQTVVQWSSECRGSIAFLVATSYQAPKLGAIAQLLREGQLDTASGNSSSEEMVDTGHRKWSTRWISIDKGAKKLFIRQSPESEPLHELNLRHMRLPETAISGKSRKRTFTLRPLDTHDNTSSYGFKAPNVTLRNMWLQDIADCCAISSKQKLLPRESDNESCYVAHGIMFVSCEEPLDTSKRSRENQWRSCEDGSLLPDIEMDRDTVLEKVSLALSLYAEQVKCGLVEPVLDAMRKLLVDKVTNPALVGEGLVEYMCEAVDGAGKGNNKRTHKITKRIY